MKYKFLIAIVLISISFCSLGQKKASFIKMTKGALYSEKKRTPLMNVMSLPDGKYLQLRYKNTIFSKGKELKMEILNNSLSILKESLLQFQYQGKSIDFEDYIQKDDKLYVFTSYKNKEKKIKYLFGQIIDLNTLSVEMPMKKIMELSFDNHTSGNSGSFSIVSDNNVENILLHAELPYSKNEAEKYQIVMVDKNLEKVWQLDRKMSYKDRSVTVMGWVVDNAGNAFLTFEVKGSKKDPIPESEEGIYVSAITQNGTSDNTTRMDLKFGKINSVYYVAAEDGKLLITGFYAEKRSEIAAGIFYGKYDVSIGDFDVINSKKFSIDFITNNFTENQAKKTQKKAEKGKEVGLTNYTVNEVIRRDDGGATILAEMFYWYVTRTTSSNGSSTTTYHYIYGNIAVINVNPDGTIDWNMKIPKYQRTSDDNGMWSSYMRFVRNDGIYFIYNDHLGNLTKTEGRIYNAPISGKNAVITVTKVGLDGSMQRFCLSKYLDDKLIAIPKKSAQINATEAYMQFFIGKGRKYQDVILNFEE